MSGRHELDEVLAATAKEPAATEGWTVVAVPGCVGVHVGWSRERYVAVLVERGHANGEVPAVRTRHIHFIPDARAVIEAHGVRRIVRVAVVECCGNEDLADYFLTLIHAVVIGPDRPVEAESVLVRVGWLVDLFSGLTAPSRRSVIGLWGELLVILNSQDPARAILAWHTDPSELFDFVDGNHAIEVKTTTSRIRCHHFRLEQLQSPDTSRGFVVSVMVQPGAEGLTVRDLVDRIVARLSGQVGLCHRLESVVAASLGENWQESMTSRFAVTASCPPAAMFHAANVPTVALPLPAEVSRVQFEVDLSGLTPVSPSEVRRLGGLAENLNAGLLVVRTTPRPTP